MADFITSDSDFSKFDPYTKVHTEVFRGWEIVIFQTSLGYVSLINDLKDGCYDERSEGYYSTLNTCKVKSKRRIMRWNTARLLIDTLGELSDFYSYEDVDSDSMMYSVWDYLEIGTEVWA